MTEAARIWIVEDEPSAAQLAAEVCAMAGAEASVFTSPLPYLEALRNGSAPVAVVLDWRLERELSAPLFMTTRHRHPGIPVIYWTGSTSNDLPAMIVADERTVVVDKGGGLGPFEQAVAWALSIDQEPEADAPEWAPAQS